MISNKTNSNTNQSETQVSAEAPPAKPKAIKLGVDVHLERYVVVRIIDGGTPQPPQRFTPVEFMLWVAKQLSLAEKVFTCYEAGPFGYSLHRKLEGMGVTNYVVRPRDWDEYGKKVKTDKRDAKQLALHLRPRRPESVPTAAASNWSLSSSSSPDTPPSWTPHETFALAPPLRSCDLHLPTCADGPRHFRCPALACTNSCTPNQRPPVCVPFAQDTVFHVASGTPQLRLLLPAHQPPANRLVLPITPRQRLSGLVQQQFIRHARLGLDPKGSSVVESGMADKLL